MKAYRTTKKAANALFLLPVLLFLGCANLTETLFAKQKYVLIDAPITEAYGVVGRAGATVYSIPEKKLIRKIRIFGEGRVSNVEIYALKYGASTKWKFVKDIKGTLDFPHDVSSIEFAYTDRIAIVQKTSRIAPTKKGWAIAGEIHRVEFYTVTSLPTD